MSLFYLLVLFVSSTKPHKYKMDNSDSREHVFTDSREHVFNIYIYCPINLY